MQEPVILDCTFRDGGYYNAWDFPMTIVDEYLAALVSAGVNAVELGFRSIRNDHYRGPFAYTTDELLRQLELPSELMVGVMVNASELVGSPSLDAALETLFPQPADASPVGLVRIACHLHEFEAVLPASRWLHDRGYRVGFNLMQIADGKRDEIARLVAEATRWPIDVLYFADSLGGMTPETVAELVERIREHWAGPLGFHAHDNLGLALQNTLRAQQEGVAWLDATITGMGRGPGNVKTEQLVLEMGSRQGELSNIIPLVKLVDRYFGPLQRKYGWGTNIFYYLAGKHGIHPTYVQEMLSDSRYSDEDMLAVIDRLRIEGGKRFSLNTLDAARHFYHGKPRGAWRPESVVKGRDILLLGTGPGVQEHRWAIENFVRQARPFVVALNTQSQIDAGLIDARVACHPTRLLADCETHRKLPQPLITPVSMLPADIRKALEGKEIFDFGLGVQPQTFAFHDSHCTVPTSLVVAYALAIAASGGARRVLMAGFDGYAEEDPRNREMNRLLSLYLSHAGSTQVLAVTPTRYDIPSVSIYGSLEDSSL